MSDGLFVLGMHRSGTSAVTRAIALLGARLAPAGALLPADEANSHGYWEPAVVIWLNERVLASLGGSWLGVPELEDGWWRRPELSWLLSMAREVFADLHPGPTWVCKDPRLCLTLPFWLAAAQADPAVVLCLRHPLEIADSLQRRNGIPRALALAAWERHLRLALRHAAGRPTYVTAYHDVVTDPVAWAGGVIPFLRDQGVIGSAPVEPPDNLRAYLRHHRAGLDELERDPDVTDGQRELWALLGGLRGAHEALPVCSLAASHPPVAA